ncbi:AAA family ATPase [Vibrio tasmaniensis 1F-187]|uniref:AAA family ATPase n=1 Tax=unclassified Vibrio TaxID=2614977 RepID=UPI00049239C0|nr:AAA family ATPase [Vibrio tasmaniensis]
MRISAAEILNLWDEGKGITIPFQHQVSFLTGGNGLGKSTILNLIHDAINVGNPEDKQISTSKFRFCSTRVFFDKEFEIYKTKVVFPILKDHEKERLILERFSGEELHSVEALQSVKDEFLDISNDVDVTNVLTYKKRSLGEMFRVGLNHPVEWEEGTPELDRYLNWGAEIYQEDRIINLDSEGVDNEVDSVMDKYFGIIVDTPYRKVIDRFQKFESRLNSKLSKVLFESLGRDVPNEAEDESYKLLIEQKNEVDRLITTLNKYFRIDNKEVVRNEEDNKLTISKNDKILSPDSLSRGEKALIHLFLLVFLSKNSINVMLLDEPEIGLHIDWQNTLISDLVLIAPNMQFIIASHSPSLIEEWDESHCIELVSE